MELSKHYIQILIFLGLTCFILILVIINKSNTTVTNTENIRKNINSRAVKIFDRKILRERNLNKLNDNNNNKDLGDYTKILLPDVKSTLPNITAEILNNSVKSFLYVEKLKNDVPQDSNGRLMILNATQKALFQDDYNLATQTCNDIPVDLLETAYKNLTNWISKTNVNFSQSPIK